MKLQTKRLVIRLAQKEDAMLLEPILGDSSVMEYSLTGALTLDEIKTYMCKYMFGSYEQYGFGLFVIVREGVVIGIIGPVMQEIDGEPMIEIGYRLKKDCWGKGYATEAFIAVCNYMFDRYSLDRLISIIEPSNGKSSRVAIKGGMHVTKRTTYKGVIVDIYQVDVPQAH